MNFSCSASNNSTARFAASQFSWKGNDVAKLVTMEAIAGKITGNHIVKSICFCGKLNVTECKENSLTS